MEGKSSVIGFDQKMQSELKKAVASMQKAMGHLQQAFDVSTAAANPVIDMSIGMVKAATDYAEIALLAGVAFDGSDNVRTVVNGRRVSMVAVTGTAGNDVK
jgi:hypothetical protein